MLAGPGGGALGGHHHRHVAEAAVAVQENGGVGLLQNADFRGGVVVPVAQEAHVPGQQTDAVGAHAAQVAVSQQAGDLLRVIGAQAGGPQAIDREVAQPLGVDGPELVGWHVHDLPVRSGCLRTTVCSIAASAASAWAQ